MSDRLPAAGFRAKYLGWCRYCDQPIEPGDVIEGAKGSYSHRACGLQHQELSHQTKS